MNRLELVCIDRHLVAEKVGSGHRDRAAQDTGDTEPDQARKRRLCGGGLAVPIRQTTVKRRGFSSRMEAGGWTARKMAGRRIADYANIGQGARPVDSYQGQDGRCAKTHRQQWTTSVRYSTQQSEYTAVV